MKLVLQHWVGGGGGGKRFQALLPHNYQEHVLLSHRSPELNVTVDVRISAMLNIISAKIILMFYHTSQAHQVDIRKPFQLEMLVVLDQPTVVE